MTSPASLPVVDSWVVGIDVGSDSCTFCVLTPDRTLLLKPLAFPNTVEGFAVVHSKLTSLGVIPAQTQIGLEATGRYWENLYGALQAQGYCLHLLHPAQTHTFSQQRGLRAKTDKLDSQTIARVLLSGEARPVYIPDEQILTYRELVRLHSSFADDAARYKLEIGSILEVLFPEFTQVFADPCRPTALALLKAFASARAFAEAGAEAVAQQLRDLKTHRYGRKTAERLVALAAHSAARGQARAARELSLRLLIQQLVQTQASLAEVERELHTLVAADAPAQVLEQVTGFGPKTVAVVRAELGDVTRFRRGDEVVAYAGLDVVVKQSGKWRGKRKLSKRGSGLLRRVLYMAAFRSLTQADSPFRGYYQHLVDKGVAKGSAMMAVMRKMLLVAYGLLKHGGLYDPQKVWANPAVRGQESPPIAA